MGYLIMLHPKESGQDNTHKYRSKYGPDVGERISIFNERNVCAGAYRVAGFLEARTRLYLSMYSIFIVK